MQLLNVAGAHITWLFDIADLNPRGKSVFSDLIDWLKENYYFEQFPKNESDIDPTTKGLVFKKGTYQAREEIFVDVELTLFADGLIAGASSSTRDAEAFVQDVLANAKRDFSLTFEPDMVRSKLVLSELVVRLDHSLTELTPEFSNFAQKISAMSGGVKFEFGGLSFWNDGSQSAIKYAPFMVERRVNAPFRENRFYTKAPVHTDQHLELLQEFEDLLRPASATAVVDLHPKRAIDLDLER